MPAHPMVVFCDGAAKGNPGPGGWGAVVVTTDGHVTELGGRAALTTNNKMELTGAIKALELVRGTPGPLAMHTDSTYVIRGIKEWIWAWRRRDWKTAEGGDVQNRDLWEQLHDLVIARGKGSIAWHYVRGHVGIPGNERVDAIADGLARGEQITLFDGPLAQYGVAILDIPEDTSLPERSASSERKPKVAAHSYLSVVNGKPMRHATWAECERRVKGQSGALFKKATSPADEVAILRGWRVDPSTL